MHHVLFDRARRASRVAHAFLFGLLPLMFLALQYSQEEPLDRGMLLRAGGVITALTAVLLLIARLSGRSVQSGAVALSCWFILLWMYSALAAFACWATGLPLLTMDPWLAAAYVLLSAVSAWQVGERLATEADVRSLNTAALLLSAVVGGAFLLGSPPWSTPRWLGPVEQLRNVARHAPLRLPPDPPDVYYIVLDGMTRSDKLRELYGVHANALVESMQARGFSVPSRSRSNYSQTYLSLASSLNMAYLDPLAAVMGDTRDRRPLRELVHRSGVLARFRELGYEFVMLGSDYSLTVRHPQADRCACSLVRGPSELENALLLRSPFRVLPLQGFTFGAHRAKVLDTFAAAAQVRRAGRPMFVFAHMLSPHPPFVFTADGRATADTGTFSFADGSHFDGTGAEYREGYAQQVEFVMSLLDRLVDAIDRKGGRSIIVIQGDHGSGMHLDQDSVERTDAGERLAIFTAVRLPSGEPAPDDLTPVNVFRLLFDNVFGGTFALLPNRSFVSVFERPYVLVDAGRRAE